MKEIKVAVIGCSGVGKSSTTMQFLHNFFLEDSECTVEEKYRKQMVLEGEEIILEITDTAGNNRFTAYRDQMYKAQQGFIIMYSTISRRSFEAVESYRDAVLNAKAGESVPILLVGGMSDLAHLREVGKKEGEDLASSWNIPYLECTAKSLDDCTEVFTRLAGNVVLGEIPRKISELERKRTSVRWWKVSSKGKLTKAIKDLKGEQSGRECRFQLQMLQTELAKIDSTLSSHHLAVEDSTLSEDLQRLWLDRDTADITLMVGSLPFYCHAAVFHLRFPALMRMIPPSCRSFSVPQRLCSSSVVFSVILRFVYTGEIPANLHRDLGPSIVSTAESFELFELADRLRKWPAQPFEPSPVVWRLEKLLQSLNSGANMTVRCGGKLFTLHRSIVQTRVPSFCQMYGCDAVINVEDVDGRAFGILVDYIYKDDLPTGLSTTTLLDVVKVATRFRLPRLSQICERRIADEISSGTCASHICDRVLDVFEFGATTCSPELNRVVEEAAVKPDVWTKLCDSPRYREVVSQKSRASLTIRYDEAQARAQHRRELTKQIQNMKVKAGKSAEKV